MPKLKGSDIKVPPFLSDLYHDLRDRRLLPLVALLLVGIVAAPILLGGSDESEPVAPIGPVGGSGSPKLGTSLTVVQAQPGLRNYHKRLARRKPSNPFKQRFTGPVLKGAHLNSQTSATTTSTSTTTTETGSSSETVVTPPSSSSPSGGGSAGGGGNGGGGELPTPDNPNLKVYVWTAKLQISHTETAADGSTKMGDPEVREHVRSLTPLPGVKLPVITFVGVNPSTGKAVLMASKEVTASFGDGKCISGTSSCELLEVEKGFPETFEYGPNHVRYKFKLIAIDLVPAPTPAKH
ncbi:MAG: hypothetical protein QOF23_350 [Solirubrobacterales bacterium]|nr:hypothetical protein [Solirubrobacterales bacterium]